MSKSGITNIWITFLGISMILFLTLIYMLYFQVGVIKNSVKEELYYALMNGQVSLDKDELAFNSYIINKNKLEEVLNLWVKETAKTKVNVNEIKINNLLTNTKRNNVTLKIELVVSFTPIVKISDKAIVKIDDEIDLSLLKLE